MVQWEADLKLSKGSAPSSRGKGGSLYKPNPKRQLILAVIALVAVLGGFFLGRIFADDPEPPVKRSAPMPEAPVVKAPEPWYQEQPPPPQLIGAKKERHSHLYEEALPGDIYEPAPVPTIETPEVLAPTPVEEEVLPDWQKFAALAPFADDKPMIALVIDDLGIDRRRSEEVLGLPTPLTLAFLPYARDLEDITGRARANGHELMVHVSMEPGSETVDPGPNVLKLGMEAEELRKRIEWALSRFTGFVGINNHMGSRFTADAAGMAVVMEELKMRGLLFLDSRTTGGTVGAKLAAEAGVPFAERNVFLDNINEEAAVEQQLAQLERSAKKNGWAIGIGHPKDATIMALSRWIPMMEEKGLTLVPLTAIVKQRVRLAQSE